MAIRVICENETEFDAAIGTFTHCDTSFTCEDSMLSKVVKCPGCQTPIRVGSSKCHVSVETGRPVANHNSVKQQAINNQSLLARQRAPSKSTKTPVAKRRPQTVSKNGVGVSQGTKKRKAAASVAKPRTAPVKPTTPGVAAKPSRNGHSKYEQCPECAAPVPISTRHCPSCFKVIHRPRGLSSGSLKLHESVGMHRWLSAHAFSGVPLENVKWMAHAMATTLYLIVAMFSVGLLPIQYSIAISVVGLLGFIPYFYIFARCRKVCQDLDVPLAWWQRIFWNGVLTLARMKKWHDESDVGALHKRLVLDCRNDPIADGSLRKIKDLTKCAVLDLSNCPISDQSARTLHHLKNLESLVLIGTAISKQEVAKIQLSLPHCWIWH